MQFHDRFRHSSRDIPSQTNHQSTTADNIDRLTCSLFFLNLTSQIQPHLEHDFIEYILFGAVRQEIVRSLLQGHHQIIRLRIPLDV